MECVAIVRRWLGVWRQAVQSTVLPRRRHVIRRCSRLGATPAAGSTLVRRQRAALLVADVTDGGKLDQRREDHEEARDEVDVDTLQKHVYIYEHTRVLLVYW